MFLSHGLGYDLRWRAMEIKFTFLGHGAWNFYNQTDSFVTRLRSSME